MNYKLINYSIDELSNSDILMKGKEWAGNWKSFDSFAWFNSNDLKDSGCNYLIYSLKNRDSGILEQSNHEVMMKVLSQYGDCHEESHSHFLVGHCDNIIIRVFQDESKRDCVTPCFARFIELIKSISDYPILSEDDYSEKEYEATVENVINVGRDYLYNYDIVLNQFMTENEKWTEYLYSWIMDNYPNELENNDDYGGYPSEQCLEQAFISLNELPIPNL